MKSVGKPLLLVVAFSLLVTMFSMANVSATSLNVSYTATTNDYLSSPGATYIYSAQSFTNPTLMIVSKVSFKIARIGSPGVCNVGIYAVTGDNPTGSVLTNGTFNANTLTTNEAVGEWINVTVPDYTLSASTKYQLIS